MEPSRRDLTLLRPLEGHPMIDKYWQWKADMTSEEEKIIVYYKPWGICAVATRSNML